MLALINVWMMADASITGPTWFDDYGLYGMQYGSKEVFQAARAYLDESPQTIITMFPQTWFNGPGALLQFFIPPDQPVIFQDFDDFFLKKQNLTAHDLFVFDQFQYDHNAAERVARNRPETEFSFSTLAASVRALSLRLTDLNADEAGQVCLPGISWH